MLSVLVVALAVVAWGQGYGWPPLSSASLYVVFPLLGLVGFSIMWSHYAMGAVARWQRAKPAVLRQYFEYTGFVVLAAILLHPGLLVYQLWRDGMGLNYFAYEPPGAMRWLLVLSSACLLIFLAYEFKRVFATNRWWRYVQYAGDAAMIGIFIHALGLGGQVQAGWYHWVWLFYGVTLVLALGYKYTVQWRQRSR